MNSNSISRGGCITTMLNWHGASTTKSQNNMVDARSCEGKLSGKYVFQCELQGAISYAALNNAELEGSHHSHRIQCNMLCSTKILKEDCSAFRNVDELLVRRHCKQGRLKETMHILLAMDERGSRVCSSTYDYLLQECLKTKSLADCKLVHAHMIETHFQCLDISLGNKLVSIYAKWGFLGEARRLFDGMPEKNVVSWTAIIAAYARHGLCDEAFTLLYRMQGEGIQPNQFTFASVLPACQNILVLKEIHGEVVRLGFDCNVFVGNGLVDMYGKFGRIEVARQMFDKMPLRDVVSWNAMLAGYVQNGHVEEAIQLFGVMPERDVFSWNTMIAGYLQARDVEKAYVLFEDIPQRNIVSWNTMIAGYAQNGFIDEACRLFETMPERNVKTWNSLITGYANNGLIEEASQLFQSMPECNVISWNAMISGYAQNGRGEEALELLRQMQLAEVKPDSETFVVVLPACCTFASVEKGKEVHGLVIRNGFESDVLVGNTLVGMYAKCGSIEDAHKMFDKMQQRDAVSWSAIIVGCAMHGSAKEALDLFETMRSSGIDPNRVTFIGVLSACCHAGLVDHGRQCFNSMSQIYHIAPTMEHYGCMIDLLGRAGRFDEAQTLINKMPIKPDADIWGSLLSACKIHTNVELAEWAATELFELDPQNPATFVVLSNIYAEAGKWNLMERVQKLMKDRKVKKKPGCSWIVVDKKTHAFLVGG